MLTSILWTLFWALNIIGTAIIVLFLYLIREEWIARRWSFPKLITALRNIANVYKCQALGWAVALTGRRISGECNRCGQRLYLTNARNHASWHWRGGK